MLIHGQHSHPLQLRLQAKERDIHVINLPNRLTDMLQVGVESKQQRNVQTEQVARPNDLSPRNT